MFRIASFLSKKNKTSPVTGDSACNKCVLQGDIAVLDLNNVFQLFDYAGLSGELVVSTEGNQANFFFRKGVLIFGTLAVNRKRIGEMLLESECITRAQLSECLKTHGSSKGEARIGELLVENGFIEYKELAELLRSQAKKSFFETLQWNSGNFSFYADSSPDEREVLINEKIENLLFEGLTRLDEY